MSSQRRRVYSFSSNETILEVYSSSPPSSTSPPNHDTNATWNFSTSDSIAPSCGGDSLGWSHGSQTRYRDIVRSRANLNTTQEDLYLTDLEADEENESEESIDWDEDSEEEQEGQQSLVYQKEPIGQSAFPHTVGFWFDSWIAQVGARAVNVDLQALCGSIQLWRARTDIPSVPTQQVQGQQYQQAEQQAPLHFPSITPAAYDLNALNNNPELLPSQSHWDRLLRQMRFMARHMHQTRKRAVEYRNIVAGWCEGGVGQRVKERGAFVEELEVGYELEREVEGAKWSVKLGYRRKDAVVADMDSELDEDRGDVIAGTEKHGMADEVGEEQVVQDQGCRPALGKSGGADDEMTGMSYP
ncbi:hypothetical protein PV04_03805 [Phialophora macrospora]|uniref:Uncharacterized protein n=1 Tax=Phialophora macrospora TaxID=1851006 RepID=A0A0D2D2F5_9EURO|nr:hypothetical protein PV04_03805 [Phialophora macrospora]